MTEADKLILWSTASAVIGVALVEAVVSYGHAYAVVRAYPDMLIRTGARLAGTAARVGPVSRRVLAGTPLG